MQQYIPQLMFILCRKFYLVCWVRCVITVIAACLFVCVQFSQWLHLLFFCFPSVNASRNHAAVLTSNFSQYCYHVLYTQAYTDCRCPVEQRLCSFPVIFVNHCLLCFDTVGWTACYKNLHHHRFPWFLLCCTCIVKHITPLFHDPGA